MIKIDFSDEELLENVEGLGDYSPLILFVLLLPVVLTSFIMMVFGNFYAPFGSHLTYAISNWITLLFLFIILKKDNLLKKVFLFSKLNTEQFILAIITFLIGIFGIYPITNLISSSLGVPMEGMGYQITNFLEFIIVFFFAVLTAPFVEEVLFRGLGIGYLLSKGFSPVASGGIAIIVFVLIHIPYFGIGGAIFIAVWGILPTYLRLKYNSLTPGWLMHVFNNIFAYIIVVMFF